MADQHIDVHTTSAAPPERVWPLLADATTWPSWSPFDRAEIEQPGNDAPQGVGAVRRFARDRVRTLERIVAFEPPRHVAYVLLSGLPLRDYRDDVTLTPTGTGGTDIHWQSRYRLKIPFTGRMVQKQLGGFIAELARDLARVAAQ
ncbi:MAG: SRPBCC family protein [Acidimicrobiia bacterium]